MKTQPQSINTRAVATKILVDVAYHGVSLERALRTHLQGLTLKKDQSFVQELCYGSLRYWHWLEAMVAHCLTKPLKKKDADINVLLIIGAYQLLHLRVPDHAAISETVNAVTKLKKQWAKKLVNAVLRKLQREGDSIRDKVEAQDAIKYSHPAWLYDRIRQAWPQHWQAILQANNQKPPLVLRINQSQITTADALQQLAQQEISASPCDFSRSAVILETPLDITQLALFQSGSLSVQDSAAQLAAPLLEVQAEHRVLDVCAAPGGKTNHILEQEPALAELVAVDIDPKRIQRIQQNLDRLHQQVELIEGDAQQPDGWWDKQVFDRILLDVPCSATGVIRRHPDIKLLRTDEDIETLVETQANILRAIWPLLRQGGMLLYVTCSILPEENDLQIAKFLAQHDDARVSMIEADWGLATDNGRQVITGSHQMDGFYYARLVKAGAA